MLRFLPAHHRAAPAFGKLALSPVLLSSVGYSGTVRVDAAAPVLPLRAGPTKKSGLSFSKVRQPPTLLTTNKPVELVSRIDALEVIVSAPHITLPRAPKPRLPQPQTGPRQLYFEESQTRQPPDLKALAPRPAQLTALQLEGKPSKVIFSAEPPSDPYRGGALLEAPAKPEAPSVAPSPAAPPAADHRWIAWLLVGLLGSLLLFFLR